MQRYLEPELMIDEDQVTAYDKANRQWGIEGFLYLYKKYSNRGTGSIIDLGTGTGHYLIALKKEFPHLKIQGYDASEPMIRCSEKNIQESGLNISVDCKRIEDVTEFSDCVLSINTLHHTPNPYIFWNKLKEISNEVFVMDLVRPANIQLAKDIVEHTCKDEDITFKQDYFNSLLSAFSEKEIKEQISKTGLSLNIEGNPTGLQVAVIYGKFL